MPLGFRFKFKSREQGFYLFLMISAYMATIVFGSYYYAIGALKIAYAPAIAFLLFVIYGCMSFFSMKLVWLFRLSIFTALVTFFFQILYSGGTLSPALPEFILIPLLAYFYRPVKDRYIFLVLSIVGLTSVVILTRMGFAENHIPEASMATHSLMTTLFVFLIVIIFTFLFRSAIVTRNKQLGDSMTELKDTTQKLIEAEKMASLGVLSAGVAHEINNPLNFISGGIEGIAKEHQTHNFKTELSNRYVDIVRQGIKRASLIVSSLSHFSRQTEDMDEICNLHHVLNNCLVMLQHRLKFKVEVVKAYYQEALFVTGNEGKLHQALLNLISNAEQAIAEKGTITLTTVKAKNQIVLTISDDGVGIKKENLPLIQDPFYTTKPQGIGTGLGLTIAYRIIEDHNGKIAVTSKTGKNSGTTFTIHFPITTHS